MRNKQIKLKLETLKIDLRGQRVGGGEKLTGIRGRKKPEWRKRKKGRGDSIQGHNWNAFVKRLKVRKEGIALQIVFSPRERKRHASKMVMSVIWFQRYIS